jgi:hypothetical protein
LFMTALSATGCVRQQLCDTGVHENSPRCKANEYDALAWSAASLAVLTHTGAYPVSGLTCVLESVDEQRKDAGFVRNNKCFALKYVVQGTHATPSRWATASLLRFAVCQRIPGPRSAAVARYKKPVPTAAWFVCSASPYPES